LKDFIPVLVYIYCMWLKFLSCAISEPSAMSSYIMFAETLFLEKVDLMTKWKDYLPR